MPGLRAREAPSGRRRLWPGTSCPAQAGFAEDEFGWRGVVRAGRRPQGRIRAQGVTRARPMRAGGLRSAPPSPLPAGPIARKAVDRGQPVSAWLSASRPVPGRPRPAFQRWGHRGVCVFFYLFKVCVYVGASSCQGTCREVREQLAAVRFLFPSRGFWQPNSDRPDAHTVPSGPIYSCPTRV